MIRQREKVKPRICEDDLGQIFYMAYEHRMTFFGTSHSSIAAGAGPRSSIMSGFDRAGCTLCNKNHVIHVSSIPSGFGHHVPDTRHCVFLPVYSPHPLVHRVSFLQYYFRCFFFLGLTYEQLDSERFFFGSQAVVSRFWREIRHPEVAGLLRYSPVQIPSLGS